MPVGSQTLAEHAGLKVSPATVRNILSDLEDLGLLASPHTSAGPIPTTQGYRVFVDSLLQCRPLPAGEMQKLRDELAGGDTRQMLGSASELLSAMSRFVGVVAAPKPDALVFRYIDFVMLEPQRVLAILVLHDGSVQLLGEPTDTPLMERALQAIYRVLQRLEEDQPAND